MPLVSQVFQFLPSNVAFPILSGPLRGSKWISGAASGEAKGLSVLFNFSEPEQVKYATKLAEKSKISFDVGANVGFYSLLFARYSAGDVYSFEPLPRNLTYLNRLKRINKLSNIHIVPMAMSEKSGIAYFKEGADNAEGKLCEQGCLKVSVVSCDDFVKGNNVAPDLIKIDVEGAELFVLRGAEKTLKAYKPRILLSTHNYMRDTCLGFLCQLGYRIYVLNGKQESEFMAI